MTTRQYDDEFAAIAADDALLDALGWSGFDSSSEPTVPVQASAGNGSAVASDDAIAGLLRAWRNELDIVATTSPRPTAVVPPGIDALPGLRRGWLRRHAAGIAVASIAVVVGSTGVAAAQSGRSGPLAAVHRVLFGTPAHDDSAALARVTALLDGVASDLGDARANGGATAAQLSDMGDRLDTAGRILAADPAAPAALTARLAGLRADLAAIDTLPTEPPAVGSGGSARSGDTGSGIGSSSTSGEGDGHGSGTTSGDDGTTQTGQSGDGDGTSGTSGSDGGSSTSDGGSGDSGDSTTSDGGSTSSDGGSLSSDGGTSDGGTSDGGATSSDGGTSDGGSTSDGGADAGTPDTSS